MTSRVLWWVGLFDTEVMGKWTPMTRLLFKAVFNNDFEANGRAAFVDQYSTVRDLVPKDRLLEYQIGEGWERMCEFLEIPVPDFPYPNTNEATAFRDRNKLRFWLAVKRGLPRFAMFLLSVLAAISWLAWFFASA